MVFPWIAGINSALKNIGYAGFGPISKNSIPFFIGRHPTDKNRIGLPDKPLSFFNPTDPKDRLAGQQLSAAYHWNALMHDL